MTIERACSTIIGPHLASRLIQQKGVIWCVAVAARAIDKNDNLAAVAEIDGYLAKIGVRR